MICLSIILMMAMGCKTSKKAVVAYSTYNITLSKGLTGEYFTKVYGQYNPQAAKRSNKTLNEYRVQFTLNLEQQQNMLIEMSDDVNIELITAANSGETSVTSGTNSGSGKVTINKKDKE